MSLLEELAQLFAATDNFYLSRDLLFRVWQTIYFTFLEVCSRQCDILTIVH